MPAALIGADLPRLLDRATAAEHETAPAAKLGVILGELATRAVDKVTFALSPSIGAFATWAEQLLAESTGKESKGIVPIADEPLGKPEVYGKDRVFVHLRVGGDTTHDAALDALAAPVTRSCVSTWRAPMTSARSSSCGSSQRPSPVGASASTRSTSPTSRRPKCSLARWSRRTRARAPCRRCRRPRKATG